MEKVVVWKVNGLGDFVTFVPTLKKIIDTFGIENVLFILSPISIEVLKTYYKPINKILVSRGDLINLYKHPIKLLRFTSKVKSFRADRAYFTYDECSSAYLVTYLAGIRLRIGFDTKIAFAQKLLTKKIAFPSEKSIYDIHAELLKDENVFTGNKKDEKLVLINKTYKNTFIKEPYIIIHPFAQFKYREWSIDRYINLATLLEEKLNIRTVIIGEEKHKVFLSDYPYKHCLNNSIEELIHLIKDAKLYIGNNSGPLHIAILNKVPFVSIEGPSASNWGPNSNSYKYIRLRNKDFKCVPCESIFSVPMRCNNKDYPNGCLDSISVEEVFKQVYQLLESIN